MNKLLKLPKFFVNSGPDYLQGVLDAGHGPQDQISVAAYSDYDWSGKIPVKDHQLDYPIVYTEGSHRELWGITKDGDITVPGPGTDPLGFYKFRAPAGFQWGDRNTLIRSPRAVVANVPEMFDAIVANADYLDKKHILAATCSKTLLDITLWLAQALPARSIRSCALSGGAGQQAAIDPDTFTGGDMLLYTVIGNVPYNGVGTVIPGAYLELDFSSGRIFIQNDDPYNYDIAVVQNAAPKFNVYKQINYFSLNDADPDGIGQFVNAKVIGFLADTQVKLAPYYEYRTLAPGVFVPDSAAVLEDMIQIWGDVQ